jgi:hypothetical protein
MKKGFDLRIKVPFIANIQTSRIRKNRINSMAIDTILIPLLVPMPASALISDLILTQISIQIRFRKGFN